MKKPSIQTFLKNALYKDIDTAILDGGVYFPFHVRDYLKNKKWKYSDNFSSKSKWAHYYLNIILDKTSHWDNDLINCFDNIIKNNDQSCIEKRYDLDDEKVLYMFYQECSK